MPPTDRLRSFTFRLDDEAATARFGAALADVLGPGDTVLLRGALGAGKSTLARAIIKVLLGDPAAEVSSPSYTLVNIYETNIGPVWHADLYRLSGDAGEIEELGLGDAMDTVLLLVEWPERLGNVLPARRAEISLSVPVGAESRDAEVILVGSGWDAVARRLEQWQ